MKSHSCPGGRRYGVKILGRSPAAPQLPEARLRRALPRAGAAFQTGCA